MHLYLKYWWRVAFGPRIYGTNLTNNSAYPSNSFEFVGDSILTTLNAARHICTFLSPVLCAVLYANNSLNFKNVWIVCRVVLIAYLIGFSFRSFGRLINKQYRYFMNVLLEAERDPKNANLSRQLSVYDFETYALKFQYYAAPAKFTAKKVENKIISSQDDDQSVVYNSLTGRILDLSAYMVVNTIGKKLLFPGSTSILNVLISSRLNECRRKMILDLEGVRASVRTADGNKIDTLLINRKKGFDVNGCNGETLVITCEGNSGFYEAGLMMTPVSLGYSVLGWNMPGFGESTGEPFPEQIINAIEAVVQYAESELGFREDQIIIFGWSIGGFPATWAAAHHPNIKGLILDATFDDLVPLAKSKMPQGLGFLVEYAVRRYLNLPIAKQLALYDGPVVLIRRLLDDLVSTAVTESDILRGNRSNDLLKKLLLARYPDLVADQMERIDEWLNADQAGRANLLLNFDVNLTKANLNSLSAAERVRLIHYYCSRYLVDFNSTHNAPLNPNFFNPPTEVN